ncbi:hypothetical protein [Lysinibacillus sphaericus]|uniref:hypothetical protein n=1 Tax=Lysinibacillus sphaericus TaxID=1421 RepID=UPI001A9D701B|nr:hypothetical protein [Lysinibacillus sphaericus]QTB25561.1 hypothetical protein J2D51_14665 [Lysinibacillus sphaericus]
MKQKATRQAPVTAKSYTKAYMRLLTQAVSKVGSSSKKFDAFFFGPNGEEGELRVWYYSTTAFSIAIALFIYVTINM